MGLCIAPLYIPRRRDVSFFLSLIETRFRSEQHSDRENHTDKRQIYLFIYLFIKPGRSPVACRGERRGCGIWYTETHETKQVVTESRLNDTSNDN